MIQSKSKYWNGRKIAKETVITCSPNVEFGALYEAHQYLTEQGYKTGVMDWPNPIGFCKKDFRFAYIEKWHNLTKEDKAKLDGVLVSSNFRNHDVKIIYFQ